MNVVIGGKERNISMRMRAVSEYRKLTGGLNLLGGKHTIVDILGWKKGTEFDPDLFCKFLFACLIDGAHPEKVDFTLEDVYSWVTVYDKNIALVCWMVFMRETTGKTEEEVNEMVKVISESPNPEAPITDGAKLNGETLKELPTVS